MNTEPDDNAVVEEQNVQTTKSPNPGGQQERRSAEELVESHLDTFLELSQSDLPIAEDAERAVALTDGGEEK